MSASINTSIRITGTPDEISAIVNIIRFFENEMQEQYQLTRRCAYLKEVRVGDTFGGAYLKDLTDEQIRKLASKYKNSIFVEASGPYGYFVMLEDVGLFEAMAEAAPTAGFSGESYGFTTGSDVAFQAELREGLLYLRNYEEPNEEYGRGYEEIIDRVIPYSKFIELFKIHEDDLNKDDYLDIISDITSDYFPDMEYEEFKKYCKECRLNNEEYEAVIKRLKDEGLVAFDTYRELTDDERWGPEWIFDPSAIKLDKVYDLYQDTTRYNSVNQSNYSEQIGVDALKGKSPVLTEYDSTKVSGRILLKHRGIIKSMQKISLEKRSDDDFYRTVQVEEKNKVYYSEKIGIEDFEGKSFVLTECTYSKEIAQFILNRRGIIKNAMSKKVQVLIFNRTTTIKHDEALKLKLEGWDIQLISEPDFMKEYGIEPLKKAGSTDEKKVIESLVKLYEIQGEENPIISKVHLKYYAGFDYTINVKKALNNLQALEIILVSKGVIEILNPEALKSLMPRERKLKV